MATFAVSITKQTLFRGVQQPFTNVYHYSGAQPSSTQADAVAAYLKAQEVNWHSTDVSFLSYKVWTAGGTPGQNQMISQGLLSGTGANTIDSSMDRERAVLIRRFVGFDVRGRPYYLRKWYHTCGPIFGVTFTGGIAANTSQISAANRTTIASSWTTSFVNPTVGAASYNICSPIGTVTVGPTDCHRYHEHHQLGEQWR